jgi:SAM-dependent methyltransferase
MHIIDQATVLKFHRDRIGSFGRGTLGALGWRIPSSQSIRFDVLSEIADLNDRSIVDVGCGHGDLRAHLAKKFGRTRYMGIDHLEAFLEVAFERYGDWPDTKFYLGDFSTANLPATDYVLASGAMGYRSREPDFAFQVITKLFGAARLGLGFNLLRQVEMPNGILAAYEPGAILDHCRRLTPNLVIREDYLENDFTVFMYREV